MHTSEAWLLATGASLPSGEHVWIAAGQREVMHLVQEPTLHALPGALAHCRQLYLWEQRPLPVFDLAVWGGEHPHDTNASLLAVIAYLQSGQEGIHFGGLPLVVPPRLIQVSDQQTCELPPSLQAWRPLLRSCFEYDDEIVMIPNFSSLFATSRQALPQRSEQVEVAYA